MAPNTEVVGALFRERVRKAGGLVVGDAAQDRQTLLAAGYTVVMPDGTTVRPKGRPVPERIGRDEIVATREDERPEYIEIDVGAGERVIRLTERDGTVHELHPFVTYGNAKKINWYGKQLDKLQAELDACDEIAAMEAIMERASALEERMVRLSIPDFPEGLLDRIEASAIAQLQQAARRMSALDGAPDDPNDVNTGMQSRKQSS